MRNILPMGMPPGTMKMTISGVRNGFSLIELLVVVAIIALLVGILLPALKSARDQARVSTCLSLQRQLALGVTVYAADFDDHIPRGPDSISFIPGSFGSSVLVPEYEIASSVIQLFGGVYNAHGVLLEGYINEGKTMFCPGDNTSDPAEELEKIGDLATLAFSSYVYRQLDQAPRGRLSNLGRNDNGGQAIALLVDSNSTNTDFADTFRTNHNNDPVNVAYVDGHANSSGNPDDVYSLTRDDYARGWDGIEVGYNRIFIAADRAP